ncbi:MAG TPA: methyltransferase domain-containing protein [Rhodocyclaceae bacterium]|nr:methyltransferase domain-containing protein [Rhodocyclaceae bacterium]
MKAKIKDLITSNYWTAICYYVLSDLLVRLRFLGGNIATTSGTIHGTMTVAASLEYIEQVFQDYKRYSGAHQFHGRVAEVGPGDNCGVGLLFLQDGCEQVDLVDRFFSTRNTRFQTGIYDALLSKYAGLAKFIGGADLGNENTFRSIKRYYGPDAAAEKFFATHAGYDFIVSRAVLEHLYNPIEAMRCMAQSLNQGGFLLHKIDLRDHGMFSIAHHELKFLEVPSRLYAWMTKGSGRPNRVMVHEYRKVFQDLGLEGQLLVTRLAGVGNIDPHLPYQMIPEHLRAQSIACVRSVRKRFASSFSKVSDEDLSVAGIFFVARKT